MSCLLSGSMVRLTETSSKRTYATHHASRSAAARAPVPAAGHCWPVSPQETLKNTKAALAQSLVGVSWVLVCTSFCLSPPSISGRYGVWFKCILAPLTVWWGFSFGNTHGKFFYLFVFGGMKHSPANCFYKCVAILEFSQISIHPSTPPPVNSHRTLSIILNKSCFSGNSCIFPSLIEKGFSFSTLNMMYLGFVLYDLYYVELCYFHITLFGDIFIIGCLILSNSFSVSIGMLNNAYSLFYVIDHIDLFVDIELLYPI